MKPIAYFLKNARSRMVRYDDLYEIFKESGIAGAVLDIHDDEPLGKDSPWRNLENVTFTLHIASSTIDTQGNTVSMVAEAVQELVETGRCANTASVAALEGA